MPPTRKASPGSGQNARATVARAFCPPPIYSMLSSPILLNKIDVRCSDRARSAAVIKYGTVPEVITEFLDILICDGALLWIQFAPSAQLDHVGIGLGWINPGWILRTRPSGEQAKQHDDFDAIFHRLIETRQAPAPATSLERGPAARAPGRRPGRCARRPRWRRDRAG